MGTVLGKKGMQAMRRNSAYSSYMQGNAAQEYRQYHGRSDGKWRKGSEKGHAPRAPSLSFFGGSDAVRLRVRRSGSLLSRRLESGAGCWLDEKRWGRALGAKEVTGCEAWEATDIEDPKADDADCGRRGMVGSGEEAGEA